MQLLDKLLNRQEQPLDANLLSHVGTSKVTRFDLASLPTPPATDTFQPIPHTMLIDELDKALSFRHISIVRDEYAVSPNGMRLFGLLELNAEYEGVRFAIGLRNSNDKSMRLGMVAGYRGGCYGREFPVPKVQGSFFQDSI